MSGHAPAHPQPPGGPLLVVLSGPSGVGKDASLNLLRTLDRPRHFVITATTRTKRPGERSGVDYIFMEPGEFREMIESGGFLECAQVYGNWYGVPREQVREGLDRGLDTILKVDVQGAATIKTATPEAVFIFLAPSSMEELHGRLALRATESAADFESRNCIARREMEHISAFDYQVVNPDGRLEEAVACIDAIILAERCRIARRPTSI